MMESEREEMKRRLEAAKQKLSEVMKRRLLSFSGHVKKNMRGVLAQK